MAIGNGSRILVGVAGLWVVPFGSARPSAPRVPAAVPVQEELLVLNAVMTHRMQWAAGAATGIFVACDAFRAAGEPPNFPEGLAWADTLLERVSPPCQEERPYPPFPRIHVRGITVSDSTATAEVRVVNHNGAYLEVLHLVRRDGWFDVRQVEQSRFMYR